MARIGKCVSCSFAVCGLRVSSRGDPVAHLSLAYYLPSYLVGHIFKSHAAPPTAYHHITECANWWSQVHERALLVFKR